MFHETKVFHIANHEQIAPCVAFEMVHMALPYVAAPPYAQRAASERGIERKQIAESGSVSRPCGTYVVIVVSQ